MSLIIPANTLASGGFAVDNSLRFNKGSSDNLTRTPSSQSDLQKSTFSFWLKRSTLGEQLIFSTGSPDTSGSLFEIYFDGGDSIHVETASPSLVTNRKFRDVSAWYHIVVAVDTTQGTDTNRVKIYVNGVQETSFSLEQYPSLNANLNFNKTNVHYIGVLDPTYGTYFDGYMAEVVEIDGQQLDATSFGEFDEDSGIWKPIDVSGLTFGTNGFYLDFENSGALGADVSGNTNNFTVNNLTAIDQTTDTPTNNFATFNSLSKNDAGTVTFSNGNLTTAHSGTDSRYASYSTIGASTGKWYAEIRIDASSQPDVIIGVGSNIENINRLGTYLGTGSDPTSIGYFANDGDKYIDDVASSYGNSFAVGNIIGIAMDLDNNKLYFSKNGTWQNSGNPESGATGTGALSLTANLTYFIGSAHATTTTRTSTYSANFGNPTFTGTDQSDGNSRGSFEYAPPSGYLSLCTASLSEVLG